ncbi:hypothetical protein E8A74_34250 [Polyangium fumosum]|uniref:Galactose oxidase n=2 Tax=Polyangium TaxID=55 RepID=A0A4U1J0S1_9BACT|nr:hypothetical protein E8A74_34250 [Polyangium fumosum]
MRETRFGNVALGLPDGRVLVAGGENDNGSTLASVEIYDPSANTWLLAPALGSPRAVMAAALLDDGSVLFTGGWAPPEAWASCEVHLPKPAE